MRKLLVVDPGGEYSRILLRALGNRHRVECCGTGNEALELAEHFQPDGIVLDLNMPEVDGISLLSGIRNLGCSAAVLAVTTLFTPYIQQGLQLLAVSYVMMKPCNPRALAARTEDLLRFPMESRSTEPYVRITSALLSLGMRSGHEGFSFLLPAILYRARHPRAAITKQIYPAVAEACGVSPQQVERDIRLAIASGWKYGDRQTWERFFPGETKVPSNDRFLRRMADALRL